MISSRNSLRIALGIAFFALAAKFPSSNADKGTFIVGGENATKNEFPWLVHFDVSLNEEESRFCSGALIDLKHVLTAASCFIGHDGEPIRVVAGDHILDEVDGSEKEAVGEEIIIHPGFNSTGNLDKDIAILKLTSSLEKTDAVSPIGLPSVAVDPEFYGNGIAAGWGELNISYGATEEGPFSPILQKVEVKIHNSFSCKILSPQLPTDQFCTFDNNKGAYRGDIGGPLICEDDELESIVCGILSNTKKNGSSSVVGGYVEVSFYLDWIEENTGVIQPTTVPSTTRPTIPTTTTPTTISTAIPTTARTTTPSEATTGSISTSDTTPESSGTSSIVSTSSTSEETSSKISSSSPLESDGTTPTIIPPTTTPQGEDLSTTPEDSSASPSFSIRLSISFFSVLVTAWRL